ncbi:hypothetical protein EV670_3276 [Rivibacter subsaxonicus]|uniref:Uncharacterized protein n=1 Tax=Rivibacter subsaxonicus TaxID=457575 RepID=A0A4Q7VDZ0_9BURK|nr:hypothetical protein EV670_3276 [Rivibacter subsaxonicus]
MDTLEWIFRCAMRLREQWPRADEVELADTARDLSLQEHLRALEPEDAAVAWLRQGIPSAA